MMIGVRGNAFHNFFKLFWKFLSPMTLAVCIIYFVQCFNVFILYNVVIV